MPQALREDFKVRPHDQIGAWETNHGRYRGYAHSLLREHESLCEEIAKMWPIAVNQPIRDPRLYPEIDELARRRAQTSDSARMYAAMAVEGFLNFYGVVRLGQLAFDEHIERMGLIPKLRALLLFCDHVSVPRNDPLMAILDSIARGRNSLVHPKTKEVEGDLESHARSRVGVRMPEAARDAVRDMEEFFGAFAALVPNAAALLERKSDS